MPAFAGIGVLIWREQTLLLGQRIMADGSRCWQFPGGSPEPGESAIACAARELREETGLLAKAYRHLGFIDQSFDVNGNDAFALLVSCEYAGGEAENPEPEKCDGWQWFDYRRLPKPLFAPIDIFLREMLMRQQTDLYRLHCQSPVMAAAP